jgi:hypothetical protein
VDSGQASQLAAVFANGTGTLDQGVGAVSSGVPVSVKPTSTTTYTLTVAGAGGSVTASATVTVNPPLPLGTPVLIAGSDDTGRVVNPPADWSLAAGPWNAKGASYNPTTHRIVFETYREDIRGGSLADPGITAQGVTQYYRCGPATGTLASSGTTILYVANPDGSGARSIGAADVVDGKDGAQIYKALPSTNGTPGAVVRQTGAVVYANQNKDLATWWPDGSWIIAGVELPRHALTHAAGVSEVGMFNDLWAISADGKTWVQLTDFVSTWSHWDHVAYIPYASLDRSNSPTGPQFANYAAGKAHIPFEAYHSSPAGQAPPASGTMRPKLSQGLSGDVAGSAKLVWAERVGLAAYTWGGVLQLAMADAVLSGGMPALVNYRRNLTPTPAHPAGEGLWSNPGGATVIGAGYESWGFTEGDQGFLLATDAFLSTSSPAVIQNVSSSSQAFSDVGLWTWRGPASLVDLTAYSPTIYPYADNAGPSPVGKYGHWEEPAVQWTGLDGVSRVAFASSANLTPAWDPLHFSTFGLDVWVVPTDLRGQARKVTHFNEPASAPRAMVYPTAVHSDGSLYLTYAPSTGAGTNPPGRLYRLRLE